VKGIYTGLSQYRSDILCLPDVLPASYQFIPGDPHDYGEIFAGFIFDALDDLQRKLQACINGTAIFVCAPVSHRRKKTAHQHITMGSMQFYTVKAGLSGPPGSLAKLGDDRFDLLNSKLPAVLSGGRILDNRRPYGLRAAEKR